MVGLDGFAWPSKNVDDRVCGSQVGCGTETTTISALPIESSRSSNPPKDTFSLQIPRGSPPKTNLDKSLFNETQTLGIWILFHPNKNCNLNENQLVLQKNTLSRSIELEPAIASKTPTPTFLEVEMVARTRLNPRDSLRDEKPIEPVISPATKFSDERTKCAHYLRASVQRFWFANGALLLLGLIFLAFGTVTLLRTTKPNSSTAAAEGQSLCSTTRQKSVFGDLAIACGVVSVMFVLQNAILAAFHTGMPFHRHVELE